jgi:hypothetical protein
MGGRSSGSREFGSAVYRAVRLALPAADSSNKCREAKPRDKDV